MAEVGANFEGIGQDGDWRTPSGRGSALDYRNGTPRARRLFTCRSFRVLEATLLTVLRTLRAEERVGPLWVLVPTNVLCTHLARRFANECGGYANVRFLTLVDFAAEIAEGDLLAGGAGPLPPFFDRALVRSLMRRSGVADTFGHVCQTPGFQQAVLGVLHDLAEARLEPGALRAVAESAPQGSPTREKFFRLADLAEEVRRQRRAIGVFDRSDLLEAASVGLESGRDLPGPLLVYGFYDLTPLQQRLLAAAMARADTVAWMPWDNTPAFAYATPTRTWFQSLGFQIDALPPPEAAASDLGRAQGFVFQAPDYREQRADGSLRVISAPGELREAREVCRAVLRLVAQRGLALDQIGVLMRGAEPYRRLITDQLERAGIPFFCSSRTTLAGTVAGRSLLLLLQIRLENFSRARVVEWLNVAPLHPEHRAVTAASCDRCTRAAGVVAGADEWRVRLARLQERQARAPRDGRDQAGPGADGRGPEDLRRLRAFVEAR